MRPRARTLTSVHDALLEDLFTPATIIGRRVRVRVDGSKLHKILVDINDRDTHDSRLRVAAALFKALTTKEVSIEYCQDSQY